MIVQLDPAIPMHVLGKGDGYAIAMIDYGQEHNLIWVTAINATGEIWCAPNPQVRMQKNWTMGRGENDLVAQARKSFSETRQTGQHVELCADCAQAEAGQVPLNTA